MLFVLLITEKILAKRVFFYFKHYVVFLSLQQIKDELCEVVAEMEALDTQDDCKHGGNSKDKQMSIGRKKFNMDPKKGKISSN